MAVFAAPKEFFVGGEATHVVIDEDREREALPQWVADLNMMPVEIPGIHTTPVLRVNIAGERAAYADDLLRRDSRMDEEFYNAVGQHFYRSRMLMAQRDLLALYKLNVT